MTERDVTEMRAQQRLEEAERNGNLEGVEDEIETLRWLDSRRLTLLALCSKPYHEITRDA
ncbi:hypothetical protein [Pseudomonas sp. SG-MS2]|uniref:hypothetical protein n=1 Tax=Pseudomonas sp. SG-MS2 TaxID=1914534 RepID=UPI00353211EF